MLITTTTCIKRGAIPKSIIISEARFRRRVLKYGVTKASIRCHRSCKTIYKWKKTYDGSWQSLIEKTIDYIIILINHRIRAATPRYNSKVERQHRTDEKRFYKKMKMYNLEDGRKQLVKYNKKSNNIPKICLGCQTQNEIIERYLGVM